MSTVVELDINRVVFEGMRIKAFKSFLTNNGVGIGIRDILELRECGYHQPDGRNLKKYYTGRQLLVRVSGILNSTVPGIVEGYYMISFDVI